MNRPSASLSAAATFVAALFTASAASAEESPAVEAPPPAAAPVATVATPVVETAAPAPAIAPVRPVSVDADVEAGGGRRDRLRVGALVGVGFPRPLAFEGFVKVHRLVGLGAEYSVLPQVSVAGADITYGAVAADVRLFPFKSSFFIGLRGGRQWLEARTSVSAPSRSSLETMNAETWFVNPRIGVLHTFDNGVTLGFDAGIQLPISPSYARSGANAGASGDPTGVEGTLRTVANVLGNKPTPTIDLFRVGFLF